MSIESEGNHLIQAYETTEQLKNPPVDLSIRFNKPGKTLMSLAIKLTVF